MKSITQKIQNIIKLKVNINRIVILNRNYFYTTTFFVVCGMNKSLIRVKEMQIFLNLKL